MNVGSLFSGIGGLDLGLHQAGHRHVFFCESDPYRRDVLRARWPEVPVYEDVRSLGVRLTPRRSIDARDKRSADLGVWDGQQGAVGVDLLCGGFPCQDLSVAGKRRGLAGNRSGLFFEFARIIESLRPRWILVENVPGLLSSQGGRDFGVVLGTLADLGYGVAWRILDSRFFGVPQRRRRVFIVGALADGDPRAAAERAGQVLAVGSGCPGHLAPRGETRSDVAVASISGLGDGGPDDNDGQAGRIIVSTLQNAGRDPRGVPSTDEAAGGQLVVISDLFGERGADLEVADLQLAAGSERTGITLKPNFETREDVVGDLVGVPRVAVERLDVQVNQDGAGHGSSLGDGDSATLPPSGANGEGGDGDTFLPSPAPVVPVKLYESRLEAAAEAAAEARNIAVPISGDALRGEGTAKTPSADAKGNIRLRDPELGIGEEGDPAFTLSATSPGAVGVRRLTPTECERLQGFPDGWTQLGDTPDSRRYSALGDAVTVNVAYWIGHQLLGHVRSGVAA